MEMSSTIRARKIQSTIPLSYNAQPQRDTAKRRFLSSRDLILCLAFCLIAFGLLSQEGKIPTVTKFESSGKKYSYYFATNLYNSEQILPQFTRELLDTVEQLGRGNCFVSIFESGSKDNTPLLLAKFRKVLEKRGIANSVVSVPESWQSFCNVIPSVYDRNLCLDRARISKKSLRNNPKRVRIPILATFRNMALLPLLLASEISDSYIAPNSPNQLATNLLADQLVKAAKWVISASEKSLSWDDEDFPKWWSDLPAEIRSMAATSFASEKLRNMDIWSIKESNLGLPGSVMVVFLNDVLFSSSDIMTLIDTNGGPTGYDMACAMDFEHLKFYDTWVARDITGASMSAWYPYIREPITQQRLRKGLPFPVFSCWNGAVVTHGVHIVQNGLLARASMPQEIRSPNPLVHDSQRLEALQTVLPIGDDGTYDSHCPASECQLWCKDLWSLNATRIMMNPQVKFYYNGFTRFLHKVVMPVVNTLFLSWTNQIERPHPMLRSHHIDCANVYASRAPKEMIAQLLTPRPLIQSNKYHRLTAPSVEHSTLSPTEQTMWHTALSQVYWRDAYSTSIDPSNQTPWKIAKRWDQPSADYKQIEEHTIHGRNLPYLDGQEISVYNSPLFIACGVDSEDKCASGLKDKISM